MMTDQQAKYGTHRARSCEWPVGLTKSGVTFCGSPSLVRPHAYCEEHMAMAYQSSKKKPEKPEDQIRQQNALKAELKRLRKEKLDF